MKYSLSLDVKNTLHKLFETHGVQVSKSNQLAKDILKLSDTYKNELVDHSAIWEKKSLLNAYLAYTLPLNIIRITSALFEMKKYFKQPPKTIYDYGCGPGTGQLALYNANINFNALFASDKSKKALEIYQDWNQDNNVKIEKEQSLSIQNSSLALFSYSFNEMPSLPEQIYKHDHILIIEPSTQSSARRLQAQRDDFTKQGYNILSPCTHSSACPLLTHSKKDWCHHRIHVDQPDWLIKLEKYLPIKNNTLTYSYLLLSKTQENPNQGYGRIIGDLLKEKGKTKQAFCRNEQREFITLLKRNKIRNSTNRGDVLKLNRELEIKGNEIRVEQEDDISVI